MTTLQKTYFFGKICSFKYQIKSTIFCFYLISIKIKVVFEVNFLFAYFKIKDFENGNIIEYAKDYLLI